MDYEDTRAVVTARRDGKVEGVPTIEQAQALALTMVERLGIERAQLATKPNSAEIKARFVAGTRGWFDKELNAMVKETNRVGINFARRLDGLDFAGGWTSGGFSVDFGNRQKIAKLNLSWRHLKRHESHHVSSPKSMLERLKRGEATMIGPLLDATQVKSLAITRVTPFYLGGLGDRPQPFVHPFAILTTSADLGHTNAMLELNCTILDRKE